MVLVCGKERKLFELFQHAKNIFQTTYNNRENRSNVCEHREYEYLLLKNYYRTAVGKVLTSVHLRAEKFVALILKIQHFFNGKS